MSRRLANLSVGSLITPGTKKAKGLALPSLIIETEQIGETQQLNQILEVQQISQISGIQPFLLKELIPDLIYIMKNEGVEALQRAIERADPSQPQSIIFNHPSQEAHEATQKVEIELILNKPEVVERDDIQCRCGSRKIQTAVVQTRGGDEPATVFARCVACNARWKFSAA